MTGGNIENCTTKANIEEGSFGNLTGYCGGIVGYAQTANIKNCKFSGNLKSTSTYANDPDYTGGIVGYLNNGSTVEDNTVENAIITGSTYGATGGIVGLLYANSTVKNNTSYAQILGESQQHGGIIGKVEAATYTSEGNKYQNDSYGIGYDSDGNPSNNGCEKIVQAIKITTSSLTAAYAETAYSFTLKTDANEGTSVSRSLTDE